MYFFADTEIMSQNTQHAVFRFYCEQIHSVEMTIPSVSATLIAPISETAVLIGLEPTITKRIP